MFVQCSCFLYVIGIGVVAAAAVLAWTTDVSSVPAVFFELMTDESEDNQTRGRGLGGMERVVVFIFKHNNNSTLKKNVYKSSKESL